MTKCRFDESNDEANNECERCEHDDPICRTFFAHAAKSWKAEEEDNRATIVRLTEERDKAQANYQFMVDKACDEKLPAYREMGVKLAAMEAERDKALAEVAAVKKFHEDDIVDILASRDEEIVNSAVLLRERNEALALVEKFRAHAEFCRKCGDCDWQCAQDDGKERTDPNYDATTLSPSGEGLCQFDSILRAATSLSASKRKGGTDGRST
jgi:hypothetical protein